MPVDFNEVKIFGNKTLAGLFKEIYDTTQEKKELITEAITQLKELIKTVGDAISLAGHISSYMDILVKNNEHLLKMAAIVQKAVARSESGEGDSLLTDEEKKQLMHEINMIEKEAKHPKANA